ncbi:MAG: thiamine diphosphokinase [Bacteroidota bacterium]
MKHALIVCNGFPPSKPLLHQFVNPDTYLIGADGGAHHLLDAGFVPDIVIGDLDSFSHHNPTGYTVIHDADQETNDLEKALNLAHKEAFRNVVVLGATGRRLDHSLKNLSVLQQCAPRFHDLIFVDEAFYIRLIPKAFETDIDPGAIISLFPISGEVGGIQTEGLKYPLNNESLTNGLRDGTSNEAVESRIRIRYTTGDLIGFFERTQEQ